jgi:hypothetical protein
MKEFSKREVTVTLLGEEWAAVLAKACGKPLSVHGRQVYVAAAQKLGDQLLAAAATEEAT